MHRKVGVRQIRSRIGRSSTHSCSVLARHVVVTGVVNRDVRHRGGVEASDQALQSVKPFLHELVPFLQELVPFLQKLACYRELVDFSLLPSVLCVQERNLWSDGRRGRGGGGRASETVGGGECRGSRGKGMRVVAGNIVGVGCSPGSGWIWGGLLCLSVQDSNE